MYWLRFGIFLRSGSILRRMSFDIVSPFRRTPKAAAGRSLASTFYQFNECLSCCHNSVVVTMLGSKNFGSMELFFDFTAFNVEVFRGYGLDFRQRLSVRFPLSKHYSYLAPIFDRLVWLVEISAIHYWIFLHPISSSRKLALVFQNHRQLSTDKTKETLLSPFVGEFRG